MENREHVAMVDDIPITRSDVPAHLRDKIQSAVCAATRLGNARDASRLATVNDTPPLLAFLSDPAVHTPIYTLPRPLTEASVLAFIEDHLAQREAGKGLLFVRADESGAILGYSDIQIWPQWAAGELGGALHPSLHHQGRGARGAEASFAWMFEALQLEVICETASLDNMPTQRMLDAFGFARKGEIESVRPDGTTRASLVWEITRDDWYRRHPA